MRDANESMICFFGPSSHFFNLPRESGPAVPL